MDVAGGLLIVLIIAFIYFLPSLIAWSRDHKNTASIAVVNIFLGWTLVGWVVALAMSVSGGVQK